MITQDIKRIETVSGHILRAVGRAFVKVFSSFLIFGAIGAGAVEGVSKFGPPQATTGLTHIVAAVFGVVLGYAAGLTAAVVEAIRALIDAGKEAGKEAGKLEQTVTGDAAKVVGGADGLVGGIVKAVGHEVQNLEHK
jgi:hypothetical protein